MLPPDGSNSAAPDDRLSGRRNMLIVDASAMTRTLLAKNIREQIKGANVITCATGAEAIARLREKTNTFTLITTALMLPDMNGIDLCRQIRTDGKQHLHTPIVVVSSDADRTLLEQGFQAGVTDYFDKRRGHEELVAFIKELFQRNPTGLVGRVLYIEDSKSTALVGRRMMEHHGMQVTHVTSAEEGLELIGASNGEAFDVVVTDFHLKGKLSGGDLLYAIRANFHLTPQALPVVVTTSASDNPTAETAALLAGANDFLLKPMVEEIMISRLRNQLLIKHQFAALQKQAEEMERISITDSLTGARNKRYLLDNGEAFVRDNNPLAIMLLDIDLFKDINDKLGHITGDKVLEGLGNMLTGRFDGEDQAVVRFGGEEFALLLGGTSRDEALHEAIGLRADIEALDPAGVHVTVSIGIVCTEEHPNNDLTGLVSLADQALYMAKRKGRNRACIYASSGIHGIRLAEGAKRLPGAR